MPANPTAAEPVREPMIYPQRPVKRGLRLFVFFTAAMLMTGLVSMLFADLLWRSGWSNSATILLVLFVLLFFLISVGCMHGVCGFVLRAIGDRDRITRLSDYRLKS